MYTLTIILILLSTISIHSQNSLQKKINEHQKSEALKHGQWSVYAEYTDIGEEIISLNSELSLAPASGLKLFTTAAALHFLGADYKFTTKLYYDGKILNREILIGNIYIVGGGDPTLGSDQVRASLPIDSLINIWISAIKDKGIKKIEGSIIADDFYFDNKSVPDYFPWIDIGNYYGAGTSGLTINDNLYYLFFKPGINIGDIAEVLRTEPYIPGLKFHNFMKTGPEGSGDNGYIYCAPNQYYAQLRGIIPAGVKEFSIKGSIPDPALFAAQYLSAQLGINNISVSSPAEKLKSPKIYNDSKLITVTVSPPLKDIVYIINKKSFNLYAEMILKAIALKVKGEGSIFKGVETIKEFFEQNNIPTGGLDLYDGSGLSRTNTITAKMMVKLLSFISKHKIFNVFYSSLGEAGNPNDISSFKSWGVGTPIAMNARIKSGTINGVRSHSGYIRNKSGRLISFSFIANNFSGSSREINEIHQKILISLAELND